MPSLDKCCVGTPFYHAGLSLWIFFVKCPTSFYNRPIKFVSAILIIFHHYQQDLEITLSGINFCNGGFYFGYLVELFFIISGFLAASGIEKTEKQDFGEFFINKAIRIYPMAWISILVCTVVLMLYKLTFNNWLETVGIWQFVTSMLLVFNNGIISLPSYGINNPLWYVSVLLVLFFFFWFCVKMSSKYRMNAEYFYLILILIGLKVNCGITSMGSYLDRPLVRGMISFFSGCILSCFSKKVSGEKVAIISGGILVVSR